MALGSGNLLTENRISKRNNVISELLNYVLADFGFSSRKGPNALRAIPLPSRKAGGGAQPPLALLVHAPMFIRSA